MTRLKEELNVSALSGEENRWENDKNKQERFNQWLKSLKKDIYLDQAVKVVNDVISQQNLVKSKQQGTEVKKAF
ncbi:MAG TPA: carboxy terminal-processing peptidase [Chitinophagaceae bacterium]